MTDEAQSGTNTADEQRKTATGRPFVKGDKRINRKGRPKSFDKLRELSVSLANEAATALGPDGKTRIPVEINGHAASQIEMIMRQMMHDNPARFIEIAFGKVPDITENKGKVEIVVTYTDQHPAPASGASDDQNAG
jgi:hypothetical protein